MKDIIQRRNSLDHDPMKVLIVRVSDGLQREDIPGWKPYYTWSDLFWWTDGNAGCDCNRAIFFARSAGEPEPPETPCSSDKFYVILRNS